MSAVPYGLQNAFLMIKTTIQMSKDLKMLINSASVLSAQFVMKKVIQNCKLFLIFLIYFLLFLEAGSCIQCGKAKCMEAFHPECARRAKTFLEIRNTDKLAYLIYCDKHTPLKLRR